MASSLNRIFTKRIEYETNELSSSGSDTESIQDEEYYDSDEHPLSNEKGVKTSGAVAPSCKMLRADRNLMRNPTRRPNPKISNRNALLARENRRRKKEHVENLEKELDEMRHVNRVIRKEMKKKNKEVEQLRREKIYLKSVIANRTGIMGVLDAIRGSGLPMASTLNYVKKSRTQAGSSSDEGFASPHPGLTNEELKFNRYDLGLASQQVLFEEEFSLPDVDELLSTMTNNTAEHSSEQVITTEHNYFEHSNYTSLRSGTSDAEEGGGVCVHIVPGGRVSVEFCASCALSSRRAWLEDVQER